jgi:hypothetical protein
VDATNPANAQPVGAMNPAIAQPVGATNPAIAQPVGATNPAIAQPVGATNHANANAQPGSTMNPTRRTIQHILNNAGTIQKIEDRCAMILILVNVFSTINEE